MHTHTYMLIHLNINIYTRRHTPTHNPPTYIYIYIYIYTRCIRLFSYGHLKLSLALENSVCYCYTSYVMTDHFLWLQVPMNSKSNDWNTPYLSLIVTAAEFLKCNLTLYKNDMQYNFILNLVKMLQKRMECFRLILDHLAWIKHQFLSGIRDLRKAGSLWEMMKGVGGVRLGLLCRGFKGVHEEVPREEASTFQIGSVAIAPGQCTSPQLHPCLRLSDQDGHPDSSLASL